MDNLESRFTPPRSWCPHPEYWHSPDSEATEIEVSEFIGSLVRLIQPEFVLETGSYNGHTTLEMSRALHMNNHGRGVSVESDALLAERAERYIQNIMGEYNRMQIINVNSMEYAPLEDIDFAFFDSWQEGRHLEFRRFYDMGRLKSGAIVAFHDTAPHHQVRKHVLPLGQTDEEISAYISLIDFHTPRGLILGQVL
jgi:predicted O-methyltransferase YrrM